MTCRPLCLQKHWFYGSGDRNRWKKHWLLWIGPPKSLKKHMLYRSGNRSCWKNNCFIRKRAPGNRATGHSYRFGVWVWDTRRRSFEEPLQPQLFRESRHHTWCHPTCVHVNVEKDMHTIFKKDMKQMNRSTLRSNLNSRGANTREDFSLGVITS